MHFPLGNQLIVFFCLTKEIEYRPLSKGGRTLSEIFEIWEFACSINTQEYASEEFSNYNIQAMFTEIKKEIKNINQKIKSKK